MSKFRRNSPQAETDTETAERVSDERIKDRSERYLVQSRFDPRSEWKTEVQDAILHGAIQQAYDLNAKFAQGTAVHRVWDTHERVVVWHRGSIDVGVKD